MFSIKEVLNGKDFQKEVSLNIKRIVRKINREADRKRLREVQKENKRKAGSLND